MTTITDRLPAVSAARRRAEARAAAALRHAWREAPMDERSRLARALLAGHVRLFDTEETSKDGHVHSIRCRECLRTWVRSREGA